MAECKIYRSEIEESAGSLSVGARAHVESCSACGEFRRASDSLRQLVRGLGRVEAPADFEFRLRARIAKRKGGRGRTLFARLGPLKGYAAVAAALCFMVISASLYFWQRRGPANARQSSAAVVSEKVSARPPHNVASGPTLAPSPM